MHIHVYVLYIYTYMDVADVTTGDRHFEDLKK